MTLAPSNSTSAASSPARSSTRTASRGRTPRCSRGGYHGSHWRHIGTVKTLTDADGRFRTSRLPVGHLSLNVRVPERQLVHVSRPIQPGGEEDLGAIRLEKDVPVVGVVKDEDGAPIPGVRIFVYRAQRDHRRGRPIHAPRLRAEPVIPDKRLQDRLCAPFR